MTSITTQLVGLDDTLTYHSTGEFAHGKVDPHEAGVKGGHAGGDNSGEQEESSSGSGSKSGGSAK